MLSRIYKIAGEKNLGDGRNEKKNKKTLLLLLKSNERNEAFYIGCGDFLCFLGKNRKIVCAQF